ncbi:short-chain collagen C4-like isoform X2 [Dysidea avara]
MGPRGVQGDTGFSGMKGRSGEKGDQGDQGFPGPRGGPGGKGSPGVVGRKGDHGDYGLQGPKGELGDKGDNGEPGLKGDVGEKGDKGDQGIQGDIGVKGDMGVQGVQGFNGTKGEKGHQGRRGHRGDPGEQGPAGLQGEKGATGLQGPQGLAVPIIEGQDDDEGGAVYVRWGHVLCPSDAEMVYSGFAAGAGHDQPGGGSNPQCLPSDPTYLTTVDKKNDGYVSTIYGAEYQLHLTLGKQSHQHDVPCAVCYVQKRSAVFMLPAKHQCPIGWTTEYYGYLMAERYTHHRSQYTCVDQSFTPVPSSSSNQDGLLFYPVEGRCGSLPCSPYDETRELTCSVCTK